MKGLAELDPLHGDHRPSRIAYDHGGELDEPAHFTGLIMLDEENGKTRITLTLILPTAEAKQAVVEFGAVEGGQQTLAKLDRYVGTLR